MKNNSGQGAEDPILQWVTFRLDNETYGINVQFQESDDDADEVD